MNITDLAATASTVDRWHLRPWANTNKVSVEERLLPGLEESIYGLRISRWDSLMGNEAAIVPGILFPTRNAARQFAGSSSSYPEQSPFVCPDPERWTCSLFREWVETHLADDFNSGMVECPTPGKFIYHEGNGKSLLYESWDKGGEFKYQEKIPMKVFSTGSSPGQAVYGWRDYFPFQDTTFRRSISGDYRELAKEAIECHPSNPKSGEVKDLVFFHATKDKPSIPRILLAHYSEEGIWAAIVHKRLLRLLGPEGPLCGKDC